MGRKKNRNCIRGLYPKRDKFVFQPPMVNGHRPAPIHLDTTDFAEAVLMVEDLRSKELLRAAENETADLFEEFLRDKRRTGKHRDDRSTKSARLGTKRFVECFPTLPTMTERNLLRWREELRSARKTRKDENGKEIETKEPAFSVASINTYLRRAQSFLSWLVRKGHLARHPVARVDDFYPKKKAIPTRRGQGCTKEERDRLLENCDHLDLKAVLFFGFHAGLRRNEILNLRPSWIELDGEGRPAFVTIQAEKGDDGTTEFTPKDSEMRTVPLSTPLADFLVETGIHRRSPYLIAPEIKGGGSTYRWWWNRRWKTYVEAQGLPDLTPHKMRHTFVTLLLSAPPEKRPSLLHLERWTGDDVETLKNSYGHLLEDRDLINAAN